MMMGGGARFLFSERGGEWELWGEPESGVGMDLRDLPSIIYVPTIMIRNVRILDALFFSEDE